MNFMSAITARRGIAAAQTLARIYIADVYGIVPQGWIE